MWKLFSEQISGLHLDIYLKFLVQYNNDYHSSIKLTPIQISKKGNEGIIYFKEPSLQDFRPKSRKIHPFLRKMSALAQPPSPLVCADTS